jgi:serine/threonine kinase 16
VIDLVENKTTKKKYALKRITCHSLEDQKIALKEIEICKKIIHPNFVKIIDFCVKGDADIVINQKSYISILLPYYKNGNLHDHLQIRAKNLDNISENQVLLIFSGICEGLKAMHESTPEPLAHRDLKTANICLSDSMEPILVDLGSATEARLQIRGQSDAQKLQDLAEERCSIVYRAPELFSVDSYAIIDERSDIWSLGCVLYALCFFVSPFETVYMKGDSIPLAILSGKIPFPENSPYTEDMHSLIQFMLRINPMERPYIYSVIEKSQDLLMKLEGRV